MASLARASCKVHSVWWLKAENRHPAYFLPTIRACGTTHIGFHVETMQVGVFELPPHRETKARDMAVLP